MPPQFGDFPIKDALDARLLCRINAGEGEGYHNRERHGNNNPTKNVHTTATSHASFQFPPSIAN